MRYTIANSVSALDFSKALRAKYDSDFRSLSQHSSKDRAAGAFFCCNTIGYSVSAAEERLEYELRKRSPLSGMSLHDKSGARKYLTAVELRRFIRTAKAAPPDVHLFCVLLAATGGRLSEVLALTPSSFDLDSSSVTIETLKQRKDGKFRQIPLPRPLVGQLKQRYRIRIRQLDPALAGMKIWGWSRTTAWRKVKSVMAASGIYGTPAMPKGLRHAFGVGAFQANVPPHLVQRWLGHASLKTTAIYGDVIGPEERAFAARMWR